MPGEAPAGGYEVLAVRYATRVSQRSENFLNYHVYGEADGPIRMDYFLWVARGPDATVVIDTGFRPAVGARRGREVLIDPVAGLAAVGVDAATVGQVILTHAHYDHLGNLARFPGAEIVVSRREYDFWTGPYAGREQFAHSVEADELAFLQEAGRAGRLTLVGETHRAAPGIEVVRVGGHTPGQLLVLVDGQEGRVILASDAVHFYEEVERDRPFVIVSDLAEMYRAYDTLREMRSEAGSALVAGHDPLVLERFPSDGGVAVVRGG